MVATENRNTLPPLLLQLFTRNHLATPQCDVLLGVPPHLSFPPSPIPLHIRNMTGNKTGAQVVALKKNILESKNRFCYKKLKSLRLFTNLSRESPSSSFSDLIGVYFVPGLIKYLPVMLVLPHANIISSREDEGTVGSLKYFGRYILLLVNVPNIMSLNKLRFEWEQVIKSQSSTLKSLMGHASHELKANFTLGPITSLLTMIMISRCP